VNIGGLFVLEPWITPNFTQWKDGSIDDQYTYSQLNPHGTQGAQHLIDHWANWYTDEDFKTMKQVGLNSVRLPVGWWYWGKDAGVDPTPYLVPEQDINNMSHPITKVIAMAKNQGITVMLDLHGSPASQNGLDNSGKRSRNLNPEVWGYDWFYDPDMIQATTKILVSMAKYIKMLEGNGIDNVIALELLNEPWVFGDMSIVKDFYKAAIPLVKQAHPTLAIVVHDAFRHSEWAWLTNDWPYENVYMDTHIYHAFNNDDIASSNPSCDKLKQTIAENIACGYGSMLRYKTCVSLPTFVGEFSLAIDDCMGNLRGQSYSVQFHDYGQCNNLGVRINGQDAQWWTSHVNSFAARQMAMAERELGWYFWTYKTGTGADRDVCNGYWSFRDAVKAKYINNPITDEWVQGACNYIVDDGGKC
jgi:glucan 1,3-beta-glucosidase